MVSLEPIDEICREGRDEVEAAGDSRSGLSLSGTGTAAPAAALTVTTTTTLAAISTWKATTEKQITSVLDNVDLLGEILLRLMHPHFLVRASSVSRFWLLTASRPAFLERFQKQNPPSVLGFYVLADKLLHPRFVPFGDQLSDISPMIDLATSQFDVWEDVHVTVWDCKNGKLLVEIGGRLEVRNFLSRPSSIAAYPQSPLKFLLNPSFTYQHHEFLPHNGGNGYEYYRLALGYRGGCIIACLSLLCGHIWSNRNSKVMALPQCSASSDFAVPYGRLGNRMLYLVTTCGLIIILDIDTMKMVMVEVPDDLIEDCSELDLCPGQSEFKFFLFGLSDSSLNIWSYDASGNSSDTWLPLHCIPVNVMFRDLMRSGIEQMELDAFTLCGVGEQAEFVLMKTGDVVYHFSIEAKKLTKAFQLQPEDGELQGVFPCMMIWPPIFPSSMRACELNGTSSSQTTTSTETISPETVNQGGQKHGPVTLWPATRVRRQLIKSEEAGQDYASASDFLSQPVEKLERIGGCNTADGFQILSSGQERVEIEARIQELEGTNRQIEALKTEKDHIEAEAKNQWKLTLKVESDLRIGLEASKPPFEEETEDTQVKMNDLPFCLTEELSKFEKLSTRLMELGEDVDTHLQGIGD